MQTYNTIERILQTFVGRFYFGRRFLFLDEKKNEREIEIYEFFVYY